MNSTKKAIKRLIKVLDVFFETDKETDSKDTRYLESVTSKYKLYDTLNTGKAWNQFEEKIKASQSSLQKPTISIWRSTLKYAAVAAGISLGLFYLTQNQTKNETLLAATTPKLKTDIELNVLGENTQYINPSENNSITNANGQVIAFQNGKEINYNAINQDFQKENLMHELKVPYGKTFRLILSDGTKVYCDAGTTLQFPEKFPEHGERKVTLSGQAFFDVVSDAKHPFIVNTTNMDVRVLGTQFNVSAYANDNKTQTVLVEGLVKIKLKNSIANPTKLISLVPGQMATYNEQSKRIQLKTVNTYNHTAWISQKLIFKEASFSSILKALERRFNVTIINKNEALGHEVFTAKFREESLEHILNAFKIDNKFSYTVENNQVIIQ